MLVSLSILNVVLIENLTIEFREGLCALTGETGAGKSILLDSLGLALGGRADSGLIRKGQDQAIVSAEFIIHSKHPVYTLLEEQGIPCDTENIILRRLLNADGRSRAFINDQPVSAGLMRSAGELLVEIHGQFETQGLLNPSTHLPMLDDYAGIKHGLNRLWDIWKDSLFELEAARMEAQKNRSDEEYLRQAIEDLDSLDPKESEEETLTDLRSRLMRREQTIENLNAANDAIGKAEELLNQASRSLERAGEDAEKIMASVDSICIEAREALAEMDGVFADLESCEYDLPSIDERLFTLKAQARKHDCDVDDLSGVRDSLAKRLDLIEHSDEIINELAQKTEKARAEYISQAQKIRDARISAAKDLDSLVAQELPPLKFNQAKFVTRVTALEEKDWGPEGTDRVRFLVATNPGSEPDLLHKVASGGEMSRLMLALKVVMAEVGTAQSLIFDEVDSGIGGGTADAVGERLARLAASRQILVVTHSPQVAARASHHWIVMKETNANAENSVHTNVVHLVKEPSRREEIARMLAGSVITDEARAAAERLLEAS